MSVLRNLSRSLIEASAEKCRAFYDNMIRNVCLFFQCTPPLPIRALAGDCITSLLHLAK